MNPLDERHIPRVSLNCAPEVFETRDEDSDFDILTSDGARLFVQKTILPRASPIFETLLSLPQPSEPSHSQATLVDAEEDGLSSVVVTETKATWNIVLRMLYHQSIPNFASPYEIRPVLEAARKYLLECITGRLSHILSCPIHNTSWDPLEIYAIGSLYGLTDVALQAARATLETPLHALYTKELCDVPAYILQRLFDYRWRCTEAARGIAGLVCDGSEYLSRRIEWLPRTNFTFFRCNCGVNALTCTVRTGNGCEVYSVGRYWKKYMDRVEQLVGERPVGNQVKDPKIIAPALKAATGCMACRRDAYVDMTAFAEYLANAIDDAVSLVRS